MAFGVFTLTGNEAIVGGAPAMGKVIVRVASSTSQVIRDTAGNKVWHGPKSVPLRSDGSWSVDLPSDSTTGNSTTIAYEVSSDLKNVSNLPVTTFYARPINTTLPFTPLINETVVPLTPAAVSQVDFDAYKAANLSMFARRQRAVARLLPALDLASNASVMSSPPTITYATSAPAGTTIAYTDQRITYRGLVPGDRAISGNTSLINLANGWVGPTSTPTNAATYSPFEAVTEHYGTSFTYMTMGLQSTYEYQVYIDGHPIAAQPTSMGSVFVGGGTWTTLTFPSAALRRIRIVLPTFIGLKGFVIGATDSISPVATTAPSVAILGDSWVEATGATYGITGWASRFADLTGFEVYRAGQGGTGYTNAGPAGQGKDVFNSASRLAGLVAANPDYIIVFGSTNDDAATASTVGAAATALYSALATALPTAQLLVIGPESTGGTVPASRTANAAAIATAAAAAPNVLGFINPLSDASGNQWIIGTGNSTSPAGSGNADIYANGANAGHPTQAGHDYVARRVAASFASILKVA